MATSSPARPTGAGIQLSADGDAAPDALAERIARFVRTYDPGVLWPGLDRGRLTAALREIESVTRATLAGRRPPMIAPPTATDLYALQVAAYISGMGALLGRWLSRGRLEGNAAARTTFGTELRQGRARASRIAEEVLPAFDALLARGVTPVVLKGFHTAHAYCEEPGVRPVADVDILVPADRVADVEAALLAAGFVATQPRVGGTAPYKRHFRAHNIDPRHFSVDGIDPRSPWELDVHVSYDRFYHGVRARLDPLAHHVAPFLFRGRPLLAPASPLLPLALACQISQSLQSIRLARLVDLVQVLRTDHASGTLDRDGMLGALEHRGTARLSFPALSLADALAPGAVDPTVLAAAAARSSPLARRVVSSLSPSGSVPGRTSIATLLMFAWPPHRLAAAMVPLVWSHVARGPGHLLSTLRRLARRDERGTLFLGAPPE